MQDRAKSAEEKTHARRKRTKRMRKDIGRQDEIIFSSSVLNAM
jgi:hypothetical protein